MQHTCGIGGADDPHDHVPWRGDEQRGNGQAAAAELILVGFGA